MSHAHTTDAAVPSRPLAVQQDRVHLSILASRRPPRRHLARWLHEQLDLDQPDFLATCIHKQLTTAAQRKANPKTSVPSPLAGVVIGKAAHPALYAAFFHLVKAGVMTEHQCTALQHGMPFAGVSDERVQVKARDFIDPLVLYTREGADVDLGAEGALSRLISLRSTHSRLLDGEQVQSRGERLAEKEKTFAHADVEVINENLRGDVQEQEGLVLPRGTDLRQIQAVADLIQNDKLRGRVLAALDRLDEVGDQERTYLFSSGEPAFKTRTMPLAAKWQPYTKTQERDDWNEAVPVRPARPRRSPVRSSKRVVSQRTYDQLQQQLAALKVRQEQLIHDMAVALGDGDLSESSFYDETRTALMDVQHALSTLEAQLLDVEAGDVQDSNIGRTFSLTIAGQTRTVLLTDGQPKIGEVSTVSPLGQQLLTAQPGEQLTITTPVVTTVPGIRLELEVVGTIHKRLDRPAGVRAPLLLDTLTQYKATRVPVRQEHHSSKQIPVQVLSIS
ncbi:hypothetical protein [Deinococcus ruber]|uniref:Transcription elongation factor GreA/GreB N-terminal domain-containing protein n=1 Tax=Deinococcus ruber TaxID=1848197 RepID=A0A918F767_9DEIO|nr:hypothetical protein [Deinococcus ruber]GGR15453.1 hypothetical protein GCM10008957_30240 [Deinococcus ruber]